MTSDIEHDISGLYCSDIMTTHSGCVPLVSNRGSRHTSALLTARSLTLWCCRAQHSCLLSVSSNLYLFLPQSLPALCLLSMIMIYLCPVISLKLSCHSSKYDSKSKIQDLSIRGEFVQV